MRDIRFKGPPDERGDIEIGYSVLPEFQRRGIAREACEALLRVAFASASVRRVIGHTLEHLLPSIGVMEKLGFVFDGPGPREEASDGSEQVVRYALARAAWRVEGEADERRGSCWPVALGRRSYRVCSARRRSSSSQLRTTWMLVTGCGASSSRATITKSPAGLTS